MLKHIGKTKIELLETLIDAQCKRAGYIEVVNGHEISKFGCAGKHKIDDEFKLLKVIENIDTYKQLTLDCFIMMFGGLLQRNGLKLLNHLKQNPELKTGFCVVRPFDEYTPMDNIISSDYFAMSPLMLCNPKELDSKGRMMQTEIQRIMHLETEGVNYGI